MYHPEELRFINNLSVLISYGRPLVASLQAISEGSRDESLAPAYQAMIECHETNGGDFTQVLGDFPQLCSRSSLALLQTARRSGCLAIVLPKLAALLRGKVEGKYDPRGRFFETWALMSESGFTSEEALHELRHDFGTGPLGEVADGLLAAAQSKTSLAEAARRFPEVFDAASCDLLCYGESRDLANALRAITKLI